MATNSEAAKARWARRTPQERKKLTEAASKARWEGVSTRKRRQYARLMNEAKKKR